MWEVKGRGCALKGDGDNIIFWRDTRSAVPTASRACLKKEVSRGMSWAAFWIPLCKWQGSLQFTTNGHTHGFSHHVICRLFRLRICTLLRRLGVGDESVNVANSRDEGYLPQNSWVHSQRKTERQGLF